MHARRFGLFRVRSPLLAESLLFSVPAGTEMVHFPALSSLAYVFSQGYLGINQGGFPHSEISGSTPVCGSPKLIAACHVLHRLLAPRHPPYALSSLTSKTLGTDAARSLRPGNVPNRKNPTPPEHLNTHYGLWSEKTTVCRIFSCQRATGSIGCRLKGRNPWQSGKKPWAVSGLEPLSRPVRHRERFWWRIPGSNR